ncbi:Zinc finger, RING-type [Dillenia turbinata]|uniref:Zinc finger, RING-type n=1 Tax=Dillenia turbinata TaxID=194707 RepID=A0AAN8W712_9MAGN
MAGMLPGVECARRRRFHQSVALFDSPTTVVHGGTRRSSFCLYSSNHESHITSSLSLQQRGIAQASEDEKLGRVAREARERLDERLRTQRKTESRRHGAVERHGQMEGGSMAVGVLQTEVLGPKKTSSKRFNWAKLSWKASDQEECAVCLDRYQPGETLVHLPCAHRFHSKCLVPWLRTNAHCPCCRMAVTLSPF